MLLRQVRIQSVSANSSIGNTTTATLFALVSATLMIAHQVAGKATRDAVFLSHFDITQLPKMVIVAALLSILAVVVVSRLLTRFGPWRIVPLAFFISGCLFFVGWLGYEGRPRLIAVLVYLQMSVFGAVLISGFWSVVNERFDPHTAKQTIAQVAAAATLGGVLGGLLADRVAALVDARAMFALLGALHVACTITIVGMGRPRNISQLPSPSVDSGVQILARHRYLLMMAMLMILVAASAALIDYVFKAEAARRLGNESELLSFFGRFYAVVGVVTFFIQSALGRRVLASFGLSSTLSVLPLVILIAGIANVFVLRLWTVLLLRGGQMVFQNSFHRSAFELLYTPLPPSTKRPTKSIIDVAADRLGDVVGSGIVLALLALVPGMPPLVIVVTAMLLALVILFVVRDLYRGYVAQLATNLRDGSISLDNDEVIDATTRQTLAEVSADNERAILMSRIDQRRQRLSQQTQFNKSESGGESPSVETAIHDAVLALTSGDVARVRACLEGDFMDARLVPFIVPMLAVDDLADLARTELRWLAPFAIGALTDAVINPDLPQLARQRLPSVLEVSLDPRCVDTLLLCLEDGSFNVRYSAARALSRMSERDRDLHISRRRVFAACAREVSVDADEWRRHDISFDAVIQGDAPITGATGTVNHSLEHVFTLLSLVLDRDALRLSFRAVFSQDRGIRGTALEYLENVLPEEIRLGLWLHLGVDARKRPERRRGDIILAELRRFERLNFKA